MRRLRSLLVAFLVFAVLGPLTLRAEASQAERRHPRPGHHREYRERDHRQHYRPHRHYRSPRLSYRCNVWIPGHWYRNHAGYRRWVRGHNAYVVCR